MKTTAEFIEAAKKYARPNYKADKIKKHMFDKIARALCSDEDVLYTFMGVSMQSKINTDLMEPCVAVTNKRLIISGYIGTPFEAFSKNYSHQSYELCNITSISKGYSRDIYGEDDYNITVNTSDDRVLIFCAGRRQLDQIFSDLEREIYNIIKPKQKNGAVT